MRNKTAKKSRTGQTPLCRIAERVFLSPAEATAEVDERAIATIAAGASRHMDISAGDRAFQLHQMPRGYDADDLPSQALPDFQSFLDLAELRDDDRMSLLKSLFGTAVPMLRLQADPLLQGFARSLAEAGDLPKAAIQLDIIDGHDTAIATIPMRARLKEGDLLVSLSGPSLSLGRIETVHDFLAIENARERIAVTAFSGEAVEGGYLLIASAGLIQADVVVRRHPDGEAFHAEHARRRPEFLSLYARADEDAAVILNRLAWRNPASAFVDEPLLGLQLVLDAAIPLENGFFASGWFYDTENQIESVTAIDHNLVEPDLSMGWKLFDARTDVHGKPRPIKRFVTFVPWVTSSATPPAQIPVRLHLRNGEDHLLTAQPTTIDLAGRQAQILAAIAGYAFTTDMLHDVFMPALKPIQEELNARQSIREVKEFGLRSTREVSLVIPLYKETGFILPQLMAFAIDPHVREHCEIVYVLDDPLIVGSAAGMIEGYSLTFPLDLKLVILERNGGYALANNMGVSQAEGDILVLLNSDVVPDRPGWIEPARQKLEMLPPFSVVGPKLIYADGSLQHAGMYFFQLSTGYWQNFHFWKGYGRHFEPADRERIVPAVTGACMIIRKADYLSVGGFTTDYIVGDYEDSDLCLKLREMGGVPFYLPSVELYHFERQSMPVETEEADFGSSAYNEALHTAKWRDKIPAANAMALDFNDEI